MIFISVPEPCQEDWNKMSPRQQGAFCNVCSKTVVDFTAMSDDEVKNYFLSNRETKTCGRFKGSQLTEMSDPLPGILQQNIPLWKKYLAIVVILFGSLLTSCNQGITGKAAVEDETCNVTTTGLISTKEDAVGEMGKPQVEMGEPQITDSITTKGLTTPVIRPDPVGITVPVIIDDVTMGVPMNLDDIGVEDTPTVKPLLPDSLGKVIPAEKKCDSIPGGKFKVEG